MKKKVSVSTAANSQANAPQQVQSQMTATPNQTFTPVAVQGSQQLAAPQPFMNKQELKHWCQKHVNRYVCVQTRDGWCFEGLAVLTSDSSRW